MLLAIDIGNTNLVIGCFQDNELKFKARIATDTARTSDQYGVEIKNMMEAYGVRVSDIEDCIISSVVPPVFNSVRTGVWKVIGKQPLVLGPGLKTGLNIHMDVPSQVGSDRIVLAVGALAEYRAPMILMDLGTDHGGGGAGKSLCRRNYFPRRQDFPGCHDLPVCPASRHQPG